MRIGFSCQLFRRNSVSDNVTGKGGRLASSLRFHFRTSDNLCSQIEMSADLLLPGLNTVGPHDLPHHTSGVVLCSACCGLAGAVAWDRVSLISPHI
jgi:hypothetical protein